MDKINIISDAGESEFHCRMCVTSKLMLFDKPNQLYKCPTCGSMFKHTAPSCKSTIGIDKDLDNQGDSTVLFYSAEKDKKNKDWPELGGNVTILSESEYIPD